MSDDLQILTSKHNWTIKTSFVFEHRSNQKLQDPSRVGGEEIFSILEKVTIGVSPQDDYCRLLEVDTFQSGTDLIGADLVTGDIFDYVEVAVRLAIDFNDCTFQEAHEAFFRKIPSLMFTIKNPYPEYVESSFLRIGTIGFHLDEKATALMELNGFEYDNQGNKIPREKWFLHLAGWNLDNSGNLIWKTN